MDTHLDKTIVVAHYFMAKNKKSKKGDLSNKKLQKLLYYAQAWSLVLHPKKLLSDKFEAWIHGAAIPAVYRRYKDFGYSNISENYDESEFDTLSDTEKKLLDEVWQIYGKYDADYLELLNHSEYPWQNARKSLSPFVSSNTEISEKDMKQFYGGKLKETQA